MPSKTATKNATDDEDRCPNCGYCHHCGQSTKPPQIVREVVRSVQRPYYPWQAWPSEIGRPYVTWSSATIQGGKSEQRAISNEYVQRKESNC